MVASFPGLAHLSLAVRKSHRKPELIHHMMCAAADITTILLRINDVIGCASSVFYVERGSQRSSNGSCASLANCLSHGSEIAKLSHLAGCKYSDTLVKLNLATSGF